MNHRLDSLLLTAASEHADKIAVTANGVNTSYKELFGRALCLAEELRVHGAQADSFVAVAVDRSIESLIALVSVVLSGAAHVSVDGRSPLKRLQNVVDQAGVRLITGVIPDGLAKDLGVKAVPVPTAIRTLELRPTGAPSDAAYAIFTSGSTGEPKGVVVEHEAIVNSTVARFSIFPAQSISYLMLAPLTFDAALAGLYFTFASGGRLIVPTTDEVHDAGLIAELVVRQAATHLDGVPSQYAAILQYHATSLKRLQCVVVAGEALAQGLVRRHVAMLPHVLLFNEYGPTESTVWSTCHLTSATDEGPYAPIGRPIDGVEVEIVSADLDSVPLGEIGQIAISGRQLARGYLGRSALTAERFVAHPRGSGQRLYLTGDQGRFNQDGRLVYCGRMDSMVKIRGFRVEVGEVEMWLRAEPDVVNAIVIPERFAGTTRLVGITVTSSSTQLSNLPSLRSRLAERLPEFMVPTLWHHLEQMPLTSHGKVDRAAAAQLAGVVIA